MAGRVYLLAGVLILGWLSGHASAFYLPNLMPMFPGNMFHAPFMGHFPMMKMMGHHRAQFPRTKPLSRPFTLADLPGQPLFSMNPGAVLVDTDNMFSNDINGVFTTANTVMGPGIPGMAAATNRLNSLNLVGAADPMDLRNGLEVSDSTIHINGGGLATAAGTGLRGEFSDSTVVVSNNNNLQNGGLGLSFQQAVVPSN